MTNRVYGARRKRIRDRLFARPEAVWCAYCSNPATTMDHVEPFVRGGTDADDNMVPCCVSCNQRKGSMPVLVFLAKRMAWRNAYLAREARRRVVSGA